PGGTQVGVVQNTGSISQALSLAAGTYAVSFRAAQRGNFPNSQTFDVRVDGASVGAFTPAGTGYGSYSTAPFTVAAGAHTLACVGLGPSGGDNPAFIDQVAVYQPATVSIADPGFEVPHLGTGWGAYAYGPSGSPWSFTGTAGVAGNGSAFTSGNPDAPGGTQ